MPKNKRGRMRSIFFHPLFIDLETDNANEDHLESSFTITKKEFIEWIGKISLDQISRIEDMAILMKIKRDVERDVENLLEFWF